MPFAGFAAHTASVCGKAPCTHFWVHLCFCPPLVTCPPFLACGTGLQSLCCRNTVKMCCISRRRAAHFANFQEEDDPNSENIHAGGKEVSENAELLAGVFKFWLAIKHPKEEEWAGFAEQEPSLFHCPARFRVAQSPLLSHGFLLQ